MRLEVRVSVATPDDWRRVRSVRLAALADAPDAFSATLAEEVRRPEASWRGRLAGDAVTFLAALGDARDVGTAVVARAYDDPAALGLYAVWVAPEARGRGVGDALVASAVAHARAAGKARLVLDVGERNAAAIALYARAGFRPTGRTSTLPPPRERVAELEMALDLAAG